MLDTQPPTTDLGLLVEAQRAIDEQHGQDDAKVVEFLRHGRQHAGRLDHAREGAHELPEEEGVPGDCLFRDFIPPELLEARVGLLARQALERVLLVIVHGFGSVRICRIWGDEQNSVYAAWGQRLNSRTSSFNVGY